MLLSIARASLRRSRREFGALKALASRHGGGEALASSSASAIDSTPSTSTSTSTSFSFFSASVAPAPSSSASSSASSSSSRLLVASRGFAAKPHKNNKKKGGGRRRNDSDSSDDDDDEGGGSAAGGSSSGIGAFPPFDLARTKGEMASAVERLRRALSGLHAGRASPSMLEHVPVTLTTEGGEEEAGSSTTTAATTLPLQALAAVTARDASTLVVTPFDASAPTAAAITAALRLPPLKLDARLERSGEMVVPVPRATPEAVAALAKVARAEAEAARVAVRSARRDANAAARSKEFSEDARRRNEKAVQAAADEFSKKVDAALAAKEADLAAV